MTKGFHIKLIIILLGFFVFVSPVYAKTISVMDFGALGNGTTDDTTAIQSAIDSLPNKGGTIYFPAGTYLISGSINLAQNKITLSGDGSTSIIAPKASTETVIAISAQKITLQDLTVSGQIKLTADAKNISLVNLIIQYSTTHGLYLDKSQKVVIKNCQIQHHKDSGVYFNDAVNVSLTKNLIYQNSTAGIYLTADTAKVTLKNNTFQDNGTSLEEQVVAVDPNSISNKKWENQNAFSYTPGASPLPSILPSPSTDDYEEISGDLNQDGELNLDDYDFLVALFGTTNQLADLNQNGLVDIFDYNQIITYLK